MTSTEPSIHSYDRIIDQCKSLFIKKTKDYGTAWRILRLSSLTDQIFIKAKRIRSIQEKGTKRVDEPVDGEFVAIVNYGLMAMIQATLTPSDDLELQPEKVEAMYDKASQETRDLFEAKNHDYGEAWRDMRISSITDLILMKVLRVKQIEDNEGNTIASEGVDANYMDIVNYAIFALIKMSENTEA